MPKIIKNGVEYTSLPDWRANTGDAGFIQNKPAVFQGNDYNKSSVLLNNNNHNVASGMYSVAEGDNTSAIGQYSHAEGFATIASGSNSHAEGSSTRAVAAGSHAEGVGTEAPMLEGAHVQGKYNDTSRSDLIDVVGYGTNTTNRKNLEALTTAGMLILRGSVIIGADNDSNNGYAIPIPMPGGYEADKQYLLTFEKNTNRITWQKTDLNTIAGNMYSRDPNAYNVDQGPFTIYEGIVDPDPALGKVGDLYFKH